MSSLPHDPGPGFAPVAAAAATDDARPMPPVPTSLPWRVAPAVAFGGMLLALLGLGVGALLEPARHPVGLPEDPDVTAARDLLPGGLPLALPALVLPTALAGASRPAAGDAIPFARLASARGHLAAAARRHPRDARLDAAIGHVSLAALRLDEATTSYLAALGREPHYGEARLGLGLTLATRAWLATTEDARRRFTLEALGQIANVEPADPVHGAALFDRVHLLREVGRRREARRLLEAELAARPDGPWAARYRRVLGAL